jgi:hypothetical protein
MPCVTDLSRNAAQTREHAGSEGARACRASLWPVSPAVRAVVADRGHQGHKLARALNQNPAIQFSGIHA